MLFLETKDGHRPGDTIELPAEGGRISFTVTAVADQSLTSLELIVNGRPIQLTVGSARKAAAKTTLEFTQGSWVAARCTVRDDLLTEGQLAAYDNSRGNLPQKPCRLRFAHTSPVYVSVGHRVDLATAERIVLDCSAGYRLPEPTRLADRLVGAVKREEASALEMGLVRPAPSAPSRRTSPRC